MSKSLKKQLTELMKSWTGDKWECYELSKKIILNAQLTGELKRKYYDKHVSFVCERLGL